MNNERAGSAESDVSPERIASLSEQLGVSMEGALEDIQGINLETRMLSFNARIEAARAGEMGRAFAIVGNAIQELAEKTDPVAGQMAHETREVLSEPHDISLSLATRVRRTRLADLALTNIDLIDRNLFERSCDVRWWASDDSCVRACSERTPRACEHASNRLAQILASYTVYFDLVLCDLQGNVIANGRPNEYRSRGSDHAESDWFQTAIKTRTGEEYGFQTLHRSPLVDGKPALVYSCSVRVDGKPQERPLGVLGIVFDWNGLAQTLMEETPLGEHEKSRTRVCIVNGQGLVLADSAGKQLEDHIEFKERGDLLQQAKGYMLTEVRKTPCCIAHAASPGYETYKTGWHSLLIQRDDDVA